MPCPPPIFQINIQLLRYQLSQGNKDGQGWLQHLDWRYGECDLEERINWKRMSKMTLLSFKCIACWMSVLGESWPSCHSGKWCSVLLAEGILSWETVLSPDISWCEQMDQCRLNLFTIYICQKDNILLSYYLIEYKSVTVLCKSIT